MIMSLHTVKKAEDLAQAPETSPLLYFWGFCPLLSKHRFPAVSPPSPPPRSNRGSTGEGLMEEEDCW